MDRRFPFSSSNGAASNRDGICSSANYSITSCSKSGISAVGIVATPSSPDVSSGIPSKGVKASKGEKQAALAGKGSGRKGSRSKKRFVGVRQRPSGRWVAEIKDTTQKIRLWLGTFDRAEDAARAYDEAACLLRGTNTRTNFLPANSTASGASLLPSKAARLLNLRRMSASKAKATEPSVVEASSIKPQQNLASGGSTSLMQLSPPAEIQPPMIYSTYAYDSHHHVDGSKMQQESLLTLLKMYRERYYGSSMFQEDNFGGLLEDHLGSTQLLCRKELPSCARIDFCSSLDTSPHQDNEMLHAQYGNASDIHSDVSSLDDTRCPIESPFEICDDIVMPKSLNNDLPHEPILPVLDFASSRDESSDSSNHHYEESSILREHVKRMMYERQSSASLYLMNGVQECLLLSRNAMSSPSLSLPPSFYAQRASQSTKTNNSVWTARINIDQQETMTPDHESNINVDNQSQEAMWNSWDLPPLCAVN